MKGPTMKPLPSPWTTMSRDNMYAKLSSATMESCLISKIAVTWLFATRYGLTRTSLSAWNDPNSFQPCVEASFRKPTHRMLAQDQKRLLMRSQDELFWMLNQNRNLKLFHFFPQRSPTKVNLSISLLVVIMVNFVLCLKKVQLVMLAPAAPWTWGRGKKVFFFNSKIEQLMPKYTWWWY